MASPYVLTYTGRKLDLFMPDPESIDIMDIAVALSRECRFSGQSRRFYSVAQHSVHASGIVSPEFALEALLHDGTEAYLRDLSSPLKSLLPDYQLIEKGLDEAIRSKFSLPRTLSPEVRRADLVMLATERRDLMAPDDGPGWAVLNGVDPLPETLPEWESRIAFNHFFARFIELFGNRVLSETDSGIAKFSPC